MNGGNGNESDGSSRPPLPSALRPINVALPSTISEGLDICIFNDFEHQQQQDMELTPEASSAGQNGQQPHLDSQPTMPVHHISQAELPPRKVLAFAPSRFKSPHNDPEPKAFSGPQPKSFSRLRQSENSGPQSDSPRTPGGTRTPGAYDLFKTRSRKFSGPIEKLEKNSGPLGRQISRLMTRRRPTEDSSSRGQAGQETFVDVEQESCAKEQRKQEEENGGGMNTALSAGRYFDALSGPELEDVKDKENLLLPADEKWPFLLRFPIGTFGMALGLGSQTILWKSLAQVPEMAFLHIPLGINLYLWCLALVVLVVVFITYFLKIQYYFEAVRREYHHPVRVNFFFAPWIAAMFLAIGIPPAVAKAVHPAVWCCLMFPVFCLELKIYGQWLSGGQRRLSKVANPSTHLSVVGNFVGSILAAMVGWKEPAIFFWAVGLAHYLVLFVTLYQRLPTNETLPADLHPVFFLFVAAPSAASVAWMKIAGEFDYISRLVFFIALFLYSSLIVRINFFRGFKYVPHHSPHSTNAMIVWQHFT